MKQEILIFLKAISKALTNSFITGRPERRKRTGGIFANPYPKATKFNWVILSTRLAGQTKRNISTEKQTKDKVNFNDSKIAVIRA